MWYLLWNLEANDPTQNQWPSGTLVFHSFVAPRCHQHCHHTDHALAHGDPDHGGGYGHHPLHEIPETNLNWRGQNIYSIWHCKFHLPSKGRFEVLDSRNFETWHLDISNIHKSEISKSIHTSKTEYTWRNFSWKSSEYSKLTKWMAQLLFVAFLWSLTLGKAPNSYEHWKVKLTSKTLLLTTCYLTLRAKLYPRSSACVGTTTFLGTEQKCFWYLLYLPGLVASWSAYKSVGIYFNTIHRYRKRQVGKPRVRQKQTNQPKKKKTHDFVWITAID